jgi:hypothetical protein
MKEKSRQLIDKIRQIQLPARDPIIFEKVQQHRIGGDTGKKSCRKCGPAMIAEPPESKERPGQDRQCLGPAGRFDDLSDE